MLADHKQVLVMLYLLSYKMDFLVQYYIHAYDYMPDKAHDGRVKYMLYSIILMCIFNHPVTQ
jgi:hypothetical protein